MARAAATKTDKHNWLEAIIALPTDMFYNNEFMANQEVRALIINAMLDDVYGRVQA